MSKIYKCIDCGKEHRSETHNGGQPVSLRCNSCAAILRNTGRIRTKESRLKTSRSLMGHPVSDKVKQTNKSPEVRKKISEATKRQWANPESALKLIKGAVKKPNASEMALSYILRKVAPHCYKYNGDGRMGVVLSGKVPDFVNVNGQKKIIELFGTYWHGEKKVKRTKEQEEQRLIDAYAKCGYSCLIIWESELKDKEKLNSRIKQFVV